MVYVGTHTAEGFGVPGQLAKLPDYQELLRKNDANRESLISCHEFPNDLILVQRTEVSEELGGFMRIKGLMGMLNTDNDSVVSEKEWTSFIDLMKSFYTEHGLAAIKLGGSGEVTLTHQVWKQPDGVPEVPSPLVYEGRIYEVRNGGIVTCLQASDGKIIYQQRLGAPGPYFSSPVLAGNKIYSCSRNGIVSVFACGDTFKLLAQTDLGGNINASPAIVDNVIYIRTDQTLFAFGEKKCP